MDFEKDPQQNAQENDFILIPTPDSSNWQREEQEPPKPETQRVPHPSQSEPVQASNQGQPESSGQGRPQQENKRQATKPKRGRKTGLVVLLVLCGLSVLLGVTSLASRGGGRPDIQFSWGSGSGGLHDLTRFPSTTFTGRSVAVIHVEGVIQRLNETYNQEWLLSTIQELAQNHNNQGILLYIDSPGGTVYESDEAYLELLRYKETSGKPVWAYLGPLAASGGYYIACAADHIIANRNCLAGSIGVIAGQSVDFSRFLDKHGITVNTFHAGRNKDMLGISTPVTPEQAAIMQSIADECYNQFVEIVAESRGMTMAQATDLADGRIYTAWQSLDNGLIDEVAGFDMACSSFENQPEIGKVDFIHYYPEEEFDFMSYFFKGVHALLSAAGIAGSATESLLLEAKERMMPDLSYPAYYYQQ